MDYSRIKTELENKNMTIKDLCMQIDVTEQGLHQMIRKKSMKIEVLERISCVLGFPVTYWFESKTSAGKPPSNIGNTIAANDKTEKPKYPIYEKIDFVTKELNDVLKYLSCR